MYIREYTLFPYPALFRSPVWSVGRGTGGCVVINHGGHFCSIGVGGSRGGATLERARIGSRAGRLVVKSAACPALVQGRPEEEAHLAFDEAPAAVVAAADDVRIAAGGEVRDALHDAGLGASAGGRRVGKEG